MNKQTGVICSKCGHSYLDDVAAELETSLEQGTYSKDIEMQQGLTDLLQQYKSSRKKKL